MANPPPVALESFHRQRKAAGGPIQLVSTRCSTLVNPEISLHSHACLEMNIGGR